MVVGVVVAMILVLTTWVRQPVSHFPSQEPAVMSKVKKLKDATVNDYVKVFEVRHLGQNNPD